MMKRFIESPVFDFVNTLCNYILLNLVFLISCLPVITIGTALASLFAVTLREARGEYGYLVRTYVREFRRNLKSGTAAFAALSVIGALLLFNLVFWFSLETLFGSVLGGLMLAALLIWFGVFTYTFPLIARFENSLRQTLINALGLMACSMRYTLLIYAIDISVVCLCVFWSTFMKLFMVLPGFSFLAYCQSFLFNRVFAPYEE